VALKAVIKPKEETDQFGIRVFSDWMASAAKVSVKDYSTLKGYPDLILCDEIYDMKYRKAQFQMKYHKTD
jgi:hypothetical protein